MPYLIYDGESEATVEKPVSMTTLPEALTRAAGLKEGSTEDLAEDWVVATDYDGRNDRNLTAVRTKDWKYITVEEGDTTEHELYNLESDPIEQSNLVESGKEIEEPLGNLAQLRNDHEREILSIRSAVSTISSTD